MSDSPKETEKEGTRNSIKSGIFNKNYSHVPRLLKCLRRYKREASVNGTNAHSKLQNGCDNVKIEVSHESLDLLGDTIISGQLAVDKKVLRDNVESVYVAAKLTRNELALLGLTLKLKDIVAVSYSGGTRRFTVHFFPFLRSNWPGSKKHRKRKDAHFLAVNPEEALKWVCAFESLKCYVNHASHPLPSAKRQGSKIDAQDLPPSESPGGQTGRVMLVILNPRSGRGRARKVYDLDVEPILKLAGFKLNVVETNGPHHAQKLAANVDLSTCSHGIICVGGDGIVNEVLNGLLSREDSKQSRAIPIGIIPAGSDNSLIWTIMGIRDAASAAVAIVKGDLVSTDIFAVEWMKTGDVHMGLTVAYYGFMSDVLELSEKYQKRFGPLRYFVAGALKFLCLPRYDCEVEYLPVDGQGLQSGGDPNDMCTDGSTDESVCNGRADLETGTRTASNGSINLSKNLSELGIFLSTTDANNEPSEYVRGLDGKAKRFPSAQRSSSQPGYEDAVAVNHSLAGPTTPSPRPRTRSKSRIERGWSAGLSPGNGGRRNSWEYSVVGVHPGEVLDMPGGEETLHTQVDPKGVSEAGTLKHMLQGGTDDEKWVVKRGPFLGIMVCNHPCKTVQCLNSQLLAPTAEHDDRRLDLVLVHKVGRLQLLRFLVLMQFGRHLSLPFVEYTKVQSVKLKPGNNHHKGCGIDGELMTLNGPISTTVLEEQCQLIGHPVFKN